MFTNPMAAPDGRCRMCRAKGWLRTTVIDADGKFIRYGSDVKCDACDGEGRFMTAARADTLPHTQ